MVYDETGKNLVKEIKCSQANVSVGTTMSIIVKGSVAIADPLTAKVPNTVVSRNCAFRGYALFVPFEGVSKVSIKDLQGREQASFTASGMNWHQLPATFLPGIKIVMVNNGSRQYVERLNSVR